MEAASVPAPKAPVVPEGSGAGEKGLKSGAIGFVSGIVIGVASTAPGYSLAASLGLVVGIAGIGVHAPVIMIAAFIPMLLVASAYYWMNRADPDCGTTFSWVTRAMGPSWGWIGGWAIIVADVIVMANLAQIAGLYTFLLFGVDDASTFAVTVLGVIFIAAMTWICVIGIELNAKTQIGLLAAELITLGLFSVVALVRVFANDAPSGSVKPAAEWFNPAGITSTSAFVSGLLVAIFIYWGWDTTVTVNEETEDPGEAPGRAAIWATIILVLTYVIVTVAAISFAGPERLATDSSGDVLGLLANDVFGSSTLGKIVIIAVLSSAAASCQTTILPTARTSLSMARAKALPDKLGEVNPRYLTPAFSTWLMGILSVVWYVGLTLVSENILFDAIAALGLWIAFYYGLTAFACTIYYRKQVFTSVKNFVFLGVAPVLGGLMLLGILVKSCIDLSKPENSESGDSWLGLGPPLVIGISFMVLGGILMLIWRATGASRVLQAQARGRRSRRSSPRPRPEVHDMSSKTIVVGYDGTDGSKAALHEALAVAKEHRRRDRRGVRLRPRDRRGRVARPRRPGARTRRRDARRGRGHRAGGRCPAAQGVHRGERGQRPRDRRRRGGRALHRRRFLRRAPAEGRDRRSHAVQAHPPRRAPRHRRTHPRLTCLVAVNRYRAGFPKRRKVTVADGR